MLNLTKEAVNYEDVALKKVERVLLGNYGDVMVVEGGIELRPFEAVVWAMEKRN